MESLLATRWAPIVADKRASVAYAKNRGRRSPSSGRQVGCYLARTEPTRSSAGSSIAPASPCSEHFEPQHRPATRYWSTWKTPSRNPGFDVSSGSTRLIDRPASNLAAWSRPGSHGCGHASDDIWTNKCGRKPTSGWREEASGPSAATHARPVDVRYTWPKPSASFLLQRCPPQTDLQAQMLVKTGKDQDLSIPDSPGASLAHDCLDRCRGIVLVNEDGQLDLGKKR